MVDQPTRTVVPEKPLSVNRSASFRQSPRMKKNESYDDEEEGEDDHFEDEKDTSFARDSAKRTHRQSTAKVMHRIVLMQLCL